MGKKNKSHQKYSHRKDLPDYDIGYILRKLFDVAKVKDEFEFCSTMLRVRGLEGPGWDPFTQAPLEDSLR